MVHAEEYQEITNEVEYRYKWYKEVIEGNYVPLKDITSEDKIDKNKIKYGNYSIRKTEYCNLPSDYYEIDKNLQITYSKVDSIKYVMLENFNYNDNIKIYYKNKLIDFRIISNEENKVLIDLKKLYLSETLLFFIDNVTNYKIGLYKTDDFSKELISKNVKDEKILVPDKSWITDKTTFIKVITEAEFENSDLTKIISYRYACRYREKYVYKYEIKKEYYDDNYYSYVEGYIKDTSDYKIYHKIKTITNTIEITKEKIVKVPQIKYVYVENKNEKQEIDSSNQTICKPLIKKEVIEKEIFKIPKKIYIVIFSLIIIVIILLIKLYKKSVVQSI